MAPRRAIAMAVLAAMGVGLAGCEEPPSPPHVRIAEPTDGAVIMSQRVSFAAEPAPDAPTAGDLRYRWRFGDGETATGARVEHVYADPGEYEVTVVARGPDDGREGEPARITITVRNAAPEAHFNAEPTEGKAPLDVAFRGGDSRDPDGHIARFRWTFGDGATRTQSSPQTRHVYEEAGDYDATLTVIDDDGAEAQTASTIRVARDPLARPESVTWEVRMVTPPAGRPFFDPSVLLVEPGDVVRWAPGRGAHSATAYHDANDAPSGLPQGAAPWDSGILERPNEDGFVLEIPENAPTGSYPYFCRNHVDRGMVGLLVVGEPSPLDAGFLDKLPTAIRDRLQSLNAAARNRHPREGDES